VLKVTPADCVIVTVPISVPKVSLRLRAPVEFKVKLDVEPPAVPETVFKVIALPIPVPTVKVTPSAKVVSPNVIAPVEAPPTVAVFANVTDVAPKLITALPAAVISFVTTAMTAGAVAVIPPVNVNASPVWLPNVTVPVFENVAVLVTVKSSLNVIL